ncbi:hypothetical protein TIFTF001_014209 [Ficus carica]|uniref:NAF domain-containing protein n=1 Tax=Ficus carica TaxID=3494 RepID=A0AA88AR16_FICCA|nr:hypothetical protein TIFTF001_014209 [Ficus carica]
MEPTTPPPIQTTTDLLALSLDFVGNHYQRRESLSFHLYHCLYRHLSSMSLGFDLSSLFESKRKVASMFTSRCSASTIMAKGLSFRVLKVKDFQVRLQGCSEGRKGRLSAIIRGLYCSSFRVVSCSFMACPT